MTARRWHRWHSHPSRTIKPAGRAAGGLREQAGEGDERLLREIRCRGWADAAKEQREPARLICLEGNQQELSFYLRLRMSGWLLKAAASAAPAAPRLYSEEIASMWVFHR